MRVIIEADLFRPAPASAHHSDLLALFILGKDGYHTIEVDPPESTYWRNWLDGTDENTRRMCVFVRDQGLKHRTRRRRAWTVRVADLQAPSWPDLRLPPKKARRLVQTPLRVLLENSRNDRNFLSVITRLATWFDLQKLVDDGAVDIQTHGGIDENRRWIETHGHAPEQVCRLWVMCDSDARRPWWEPSQKRFPERLGKGARMLADVCEECKIPLHILTRRAIENYLPLPALRDWSAHDRIHREHRKNLYTAFAALSPEQRHHYNMKRGFGQDERDQEHAAKAGDLYRTLDPSMRKILDGGFGEDIADRFGEAVGRIHVKWLREDKQTDEARCIAQAILEHL